MESTFSEKLKNFLSAVNLPSTPSFNRIGNLLQARLDYITSLGNLKAILKETDKQIDKAKACLPKSEAVKLKSVSYKISRKEALEIGGTDKESLKMCSEALEEAKKAIKCTKCGRETEVQVNICSKRHRECLECAEQLGECTICLSPKEISPWEESETILTKIKVLEDFLADLKGEIKKISKTETSVKDKVIVATKGNTIVQIEWNGEEAVLKERKKEKEASDFIFWLNDKQLCGELKIDKWVLFLRKGDSTLDSVLLRGCSIEWDKFIKYKDAVYLSVRDTYEFYKITEKNGKFAVKFICNTNHVVRCILEVNSALYFSTYSHSVFCLKNGELSLFGFATDGVYGLKAIDGYLWFADFNGCIEAIHMQTGHVKERFSLLVDDYYFFSKDTIVRSGNYKMALFSLEGAPLIELNHQINKGPKLLENNDNYAVLSEGGSTVILNHKKRTIKRYEHAEIPYYYLMT